MTSVAVHNITAKTTIGKPVTISLSGLIKPDSTCEVVTGSARAIGQNIMYIPEPSFMGTDLVKVESSDGNRAEIIIDVVEDKDKKPEIPTVRTQTRTTTMAGKEVEDRHWTITSDTGPIEGPSASYVPLRIKAVTAMSFVEGHPPENVIDGNKDTFYSTEGEGSWLQVDLGHLCNISEIDILWHGINTFSLDMSVDRKKFTHCHQGRGMGLTNINTPSASAQIIKITSMSPFMTIYDITVKGSPTTPRPTATGAQAVLTHSSQIAEPGQLVTMDGSMSRGDIIKYVWDQNTSPTVQLFNANTPLCSFVAPDVIIPTTIQFSLAIIDRNGQDSKAESLVHVRPKPVVEVVEKKPKKKIVEEGDR